MTNPYAVLLAACALVALGVFATMIYSILAFRAPRALGPIATRNKFVEVVWALIPIAIVCCAALPAVQTINAPDEPAAIVARSP
jgi:heme/copper-type cytochrome/quinol oxidase subunit 2